MRIVVTGAAGRIGRRVVDDLSSTHDLRLVDRVPIDDTRAVRANLAESSRDAQWREAFQGADAVIHLAANPSPQARWWSVLRNNVWATRNVLNAMAAANVPRILLASSLWVVRGRLGTVPTRRGPGTAVKIGSDVPLAPRGPYGWSKAWAEQLGRRWAARSPDRSFAAIRFGWFLPKPFHDSPVSQREWLGADDGCALVRRCLLADYTGFHVFYGVSAQATAPCDLTHTTRILDWRPVQTHDVGAAAAPDHG